MTDTATLEYHYRHDTVEALARSLIVASALHSGKGPFQLPMTSVQALALGRALEWAVAMQATHAAREVHLATRHEAAADLHRHAVKMGDTAAAGLARAIKVNKQAILWNLGAMVWFSASLAFWWLA